MKVLYDSSAVHAAIKEVLTKEKEPGRRVVVVAYVGKGAEAFLPHPQGLEIICCLQPGSTCGEALERLRARGAKLRHSIRLHMKVYWSEKAGCVIGSANASTSALGAGGLKEAGVLLPSDEVNIDQIIRAIDAKPITRKDLLTLAQKTDRIVRPSSRASNDRKNRFTFGEWLDALGPRPWKLGWWTDASGGVAKAAKAEARNRFGIVDPKESLNFAKGQYRSGDWLLRFKLGGRLSLDWFYVDFVVKVGREEKNAYEPDYPFQAVQVYANSRYPDPPFDAGSPRFRNALQSAIAHYGEDKIENLKSLAVPKSFLKLLDYYWKQSE